MEIRKITLKDYLRKKLFQSKIHIPYNDIGKKLIKLLSLLDITFREINIIDWYNEIQKRCPEDIVLRIEHGKLRSFSLYKDTNFTDDILTIKNHIKEWKRL